MYLWLFACGVQAPANRAVHAALLDRIAAGDAGVDCGVIEDDDLLADCTWAAVAAGADPAQCSALDDLAADECWFLAAEHRADPSLCDRAGRFERDCRMHALSAITRDLPPAWADAENVAGIAIETAGLQGDADAWGPVYRALLTRVRPLDVAACEDAREPATCRRAAEGLVHDRLNRARDLGASLCKGPLPESVAWVPDPALDALLAERRATDLCSGIRHAPPSDAP